MTRRCAPLVLLGACAVSFLWLAIDVSFQMKAEGIRLFRADLGNSASDAAADILDLCHVFRQVVMSWRKSSDISRRISTKRGVSLMSS